MTKKIDCATHGLRDESFVCTHLLGAVVGLGFNRDEPTIENPFPDAWCDDCELIRSAHNGWSEKAADLIKASQLCSNCYERVRIRNTRTSVTLGDLADLRWKCGTCDEWHTGPCLDFSYDSPWYWLEEHEEANRRAALLPSWNRDRGKTFKDGNYCAIDDEHFFVRGLIQLPIVGTAEHLRWGVWGSLSRENFETLLKIDDNAKHEDLPAMFSWLSTQIPEYPDTINLKMYARTQKPGERVIFELEPTDHPLSQEFHKGIMPERVKEIMAGRLAGNK